MKIITFFRSICIMIAVMIICIIPVIVTEKAEAENNTKEYKKMNIYKSTKLTQEEQKKFFEEYKEYDISEKDGVLYYKDELIRCFADIYEVKKVGYCVRNNKIVKGNGTIITKKSVYKYFNEKGTVDIYTERTRSIKNGKKFFNNIIKKGTSLEEFLYVMPKNIINKVAKQLNKKEEYKKLTAIACYIDNDALGEIANTMAEKGKYKELSDIVCFLDKNDRDKIADTMIEKKKYQELIDIMWAFDQNTIDKIAKKAAKDKKYEEISKMACFVSKDVLGEIAKKMTKEREYKALEEIACFIA